MFEYSNTVYLSEHSNTLATVSEKSGREGEKELRASRSERETESRHRSDSRECREQRAEKRVASMGDSTSRMMVLPIKVLTNCTCHNTNAKPNVKSILSVCCNLTECDPPPILCRRKLNAAVDPGDAFFV